MEAFGWTVTLWQNRQAVHCISHLSILTRVRAEYVRNVYRVALSNNRVVAVDDTHVTFRITPSGTKSALTKRVPGAEFVRGFCQNILPQHPDTRGGFHKIRYYGFLSANSGVRIEEVRWLASCALRLFFVIRYGAITPAEPDTRPPLRCARCGGELLLVLVMDATGRVLVNHRQRFLDSG